jgi:hypothetical protein
MHLITGDTIQHQLSGKDGMLDRWIAYASLTDGEITRRLFLATLVHPPSKAEASQVLASIRNGGRGKEARRHAFEDVLWSIFNSKAFLFNH